MRILMLNNEFPPLGGGTGTVNQALLKRFAAHSELSIDLVTSALGGVYQEERFAENVRIFKVPVNNRDLHHSSNRELLTYAVRALLLALKLQRASAYDFCFAWSAVPAGGVALGLRRLCGLRYLVRVCGPDIPGFERRYHLIARALTPLIRAVWRSADAVVAKCQEEAAMISAVDRGIKAAIVPNGVDLAGFYAGDPVPDGGPLRVLCVGRLIERKGQSCLIEAVKGLRDHGVDVTLELVGTGDASPLYQAQVARLGLQDVVRFMGYVPREEMAQRYAAAHVFVLPSYNEGMSVATLEAMASGLPVVVTRTGGTRELVVEGENGLVFDWGDVATLTAHLRLLAEDRALARRMGKSSRLRAAGFSWAAVEDAYLELFARMPTHPQNHLCALEG